MPGGYDLGTLYLEVDRATLIPSAIKTTPTNFSA
jgi:hypothetical protein